MQTHKHEQHYPGLGPDEWKEHGEHIARSCSYCGSMHPADLARMLREEGTRLDEADRKYGWPHKFYLHGGSMQTRGARKFYTVHLQDASEEDRLTIELHMGLRFEFSNEGTSVKWTAFKVA